MFNMPVGRKGGQMPRTCILLGGWGCEGVWAVTVLVRGRAGRGSPGREWGDSGVGSMMRGGVGGGGCLWRRVIRHWGAA